MKPIITEEEVVEELPHTQITIDIVGDHLEIAEELAKVFLEILHAHAIMPKDMISSVILIPQKGDEDDEENFHVPVSE